MTKKNNGAEAKAEALPGLKLGDYHVGKEDAVLNIIRDDGTIVGTVTVPVEEVLKMAGLVFSGRRRNPVGPQGT